MFKSNEREYGVYSPRDESGKQKFLGNIRAAISHRSSEEAASDGIVRANESSLAAVDVKYEIPGGFKRGMMIRDKDGGEYFVRLPVRHRKMWILLLSRYYFEENGGEASREIE